MKDHADSAKPVPPEAGALADAALRLLAAFFPNRESMAAFLAARQAQLPEQCFLALDPVPFVDTSEVLRLWESRADYLDGQGRPAVLAEEGPVSFAALSREACPALDPAQVLALLLASKAVDRTATGIRLSARAALIRGAAQAAHVRAAQVATRLLRTLHANLADDDAADRLFERSAMVSGIPVDKLPAVKAFLARHGQQFLEDADDTLARLANPQEFDTVDAGVGLFLFREPSRTAR